VVLAAAVGDDYRGVLKRRAEVVGEVVERLRHEQVELGRRAIRRRAAGELLAAFLEPAELGLRHLVAA
jgi:hypothetical protein